MIKHLASGVSISGFAPNLGLLAGRMFAGFTLAFAHGMGKMPPSDMFIGYVEALGFPLPALFAWAAGLSEFLGGILLGLGLFTRPAALFIIITMSVAGFLQHAADPFDVKERALLFLSLAIIFVAIGSGRFGLDAVLRKGR